MSDDDIPVEDADFEPQLTSNDPNERKLARRLRMERRCTMVRRVSEGLTLDESEEKTAVQQQLLKSTELLEQFVREADEYITNVRIANDSREVDRREIEGTIKEKVFKELEDEATSAQQKFDEIAAKWSVIKKYNDPLHINEDIANQKEKCDLLIKQKDAIIAMLKDELKKSENKYCMDQYKQNEDINVLSQRIEKQIGLIRKAYQKEFELIEDVVTSERQNLIDGNNKKWEELFKKQKEREIDNMNKKFQQMDQYKTTMKNLRQDFQEKFRSTKISMEKDIEELQTELERVKAVALINSEKLDYNYQILKKREDENLIIKSQQKRRLNKLHDVINNLKKKIDDYETTAKTNIKKLKDNIKQLQKNILDIEAKADHFAKVNDEKFNKVWNLNKTSCDELLHKILSTDMILHEQHMGINWISPPINILSKDMLPSYKSALSILNSNTVKVDEINAELDREKVHHTTEELDTVENYRKLLKHILKHVSDKSGFLTEKRLKEILKPYEDEDQCLVRLDQISQSLKINNPLYIDILLNYFLPYTYCPVCSGFENISSSGSRFTSTISTIMPIYNRISQTDVTHLVELDEAMLAIQQPEETINDIIMEIVSSEMVLDNKEELSHDAIENCEEIVTDIYMAELKEKKSIRRKLTCVVTERTVCQYNHPLFLSSVYVLSALKDFVKNYFDEKEKFPTTRERLSKKRLTVSRLLADNDIVQFWDCYKTAYDENRVRIWDALLQGLKNYHEILRDRKALCEEVVALRQQNQDLKKLLANYGDHNVLMNAPCSLDQNDFVFKHKQINKRRI